MKLLYQLCKLYPDLKTCSFLILWASTTPCLITSSAMYTDCTHVLKKEKKKMHARASLVYKTHVCMNARIYKNYFCFR